METVLLKESEIKKGAGIVRRGGVVAFRTETVYGLGADATNAEAISKIFEAKGRPASNPLIVHFASREDVLKFFPQMDDATRQVLLKIKEAITVVVPCFGKLPSVVSGGLDTVAVRIPSCKFSRRFIKACGVPLAAPSANTSTRPSPTRWTHVHEDLSGRIDAIFKGRNTRIGVESTVVKVEGDVIKVLRLGGISTRRLAQKCGKRVEVVRGAAESPGARFKHYAPRVPLYVTSEPGRFGHLKNARIITRRELGRRPGRKLFAAIRAAEKSADFIVVEAFPDLPQYEAINERLTRAAWGCKIEA